MLCKKCGAEIADASKFCVYCGNPVEVPQESVQTIEQSSFVEPVQINESPELEKTVVIENPTQNVDMNLNQQLNTNDNVNPSIDENITTGQTPNTPVNNNSKNKKNGLLFGIVGGVLGIIVVSVLILMLKGANSGGSIEALERALGKFENVNSETIKVNLEMAAAAGDSINMSATGKLAKVNDDYNFSITLNKSMFNGEMSLYSVVNKKELKLYAQSSLIDMISETTTATPADMWVNYSLNFEELGLDLDDMFSEEIETEDLDLKEILDSEHFKYVNKESGLKHYQLVIDQKLINSIETKAKEEGMEEDLKKIEDSLELTDTIILDVYIDNNDNLTKISLDMSKMLEKEGISKAIVSIEFTDINNTKVDIPKDAIESSMDLETYISKYMTDSQYDADDSFDTDSDFDMDTDLDSDMDIDSDFNVNF